MVAQDDNLTRRNSSANGTDDREAHPKFWIAAYTRPRSEKKAAAKIAKLGIETYVPIQEQIRIWSDRKKHIEVPVIPMILFVKVREDELMKVMFQPLILKLLSLPGEKKVAIIPNKEIDNLKLLLSQSDIPVSFESDTYKTNDTVVIVRGKLKGIVGQVKEVDKDTSTIWISVNILGGTIIRINNSEIERFNKDSNQL